MITQATTGISALALKREVGVSYNTASEYYADDERRLSDAVQIDDVYYDGDATEGGEAQRIKYHLLQRYR